MKQVVFLSTVAVLLVATGLAQAWEIPGVQGELHGVVDLSIQTQYIWRGFDVYNDTSAVQASVDLDLFQTGLGVSVMGHRANATNEYEAPSLDPANPHSGERWDFTLYYQNSLFGDEPYATNYRLGWVYYNYPEVPAKAFDLQELHGILSWPNVLPVKGLVPSYVLVKLWPSESGSTVGGNASGFAHILMLDYGLAVPGLFPEVPEQILNLHSELVYNDGVHPGGGVVDHDWSNAVLGASTDFDLGYNVTLTPALYYQVTMDKSVNEDKDEVWATLSAKYTF